MRKGNMVIIFSLSLIVLLFLSSCQPKPQVPEEEALAQLEGLSDEERDAVLAKSNALAGQAYKLLPGQSAQRVKSVRQVAKSFNWLECTDSDGGVNNEVVGTATVKYTYGGGPVKEISYTDICQQGTNMLVEYYCKDNNYATATADCQYGCEFVTPTSGKCKEAPFLVSPPGPSEAVCGNEKLDNGEDCDDPTGDSSGVFAKNCNDLQFYGGQIKCTKDCKYDTGLCGSPLAPPGPSESLCGDGVVNYNLGEDCDDGNQNNSDSCTNECKTPTCGNGKVEGSEQCDDGNKVQGDGCNYWCGIEICIPERKYCDPSKGPSALKYCNAVGTSYSPGGCWDKTNVCKEGPDGAVCVPQAVCGNGKLEENESCDGNNLAGKSCTNFGYSSGQLGCTGGCKFDVSQCQKAPASLPDLTVSSVSAKLDTFPNGTSFVSVTATIVNNGEVNANKTFWTEATYFNEALKSNASTYNQNSPLAPNQSKTLTFQMGLDQYHLKCPSKGNVSVTVDYANQVAESVEWNNQKSTTLDC